MNMKKQKWPEKYQDGHDIEKEESSLYHATNEAQLESIEHKGVCASRTALGMEGISLFTLLQPEAYDWGWTPLQRFAGHVLHIKVPASAYKTDLKPVSTLQQRPQSAGTSLMLSLIHI